MATIFQHNKERFLKDLQKVCTIWWNKICSNKSWCQIAVQETEAQIRSSHQERGVFYSSLIQRYTIGTYINLFRELVCRITKSDKNRKGTWKYHIKEESDLSIQDHKFATVCSNKDLHIYPHRRCPGIRHTVTYSPSCRSTINTSKHLCGYIANALLPHATQWGPKGGWIQDLKETKWGLKKVRMGDSWGSST